jgi:hypothetical protein
VNLAVDQKIEVTSCYVTGCRTGFTDVVRSLGNTVLAWAHEAVRNSRISEARLRQPREFN